MLKTTFREAGGSPGSTVVAPGCARVRGRSGPCRGALTVSPCACRLAAVALLYLEQEDAFWCLVTIVEVFMPRDYYTKTLLGSQVRLPTPCFCGRCGRGAGRRPSEACWRGFLGAGSALTRPSEAQEWAEGRGCCPPARARPEPGPRADRSSRSQPCTRPARWVSRVLSLGALPGPARPPRSAAWLLSRRRQGDRLPGKVPLW